MADTLGGVARDFPHLRDGHHFNRAGRSLPQYYGVASCALRRRLFHAFYYAAAINPDGRHDEEPVPHACIALSDPPGNSWQFLQGAPGPVLLAAKSSSSRPGLSARPRISHRGISSRTAGKKPTFPRT
ncbi:hypothetical protein [Achromobacter sp. DH1f]|uniref:hypothetical protein n=1 Tax=Achromobacter sp. DH1f TaxID=1397275 RepID=UPI0012FEA80B|nr:hypothetical protein [Achromobacter sp. DH1f]